MRIIAGKWKGKTLIAPDDDSVRPSSSRMREALFNVLMHGEFAGKCVVDARIADICAGTGALGFEALSRGARHVTFVDEHKKSIRLVEKNMDHLKVNDACKLLLANAVNLPTAEAPYDLIVSDPPYATHIMNRIYDSAQNRGWLKQGSVLAAELPMQQDAPELAGAALVLDRKYGKTRLCIWRVESL